MPHTSPLIEDHEDYAVDLTVLPLKDLIPSGRVHIRQDIAVKPVHHLALYHHETNLIGLVYEWHLEPQGKLDYRFSILDQEDDKIYYAILTKRGYCSVSGASQALRSHLRRYR